jgi:hypothetical protein
MEPYRQTNTLPDNERYDDRTEYKGINTPPPSNPPRYTRWNPSRYVPSPSYYMPKQKVVIPHGIRVTLRVITLFLSLSIISILSHAIHIRNTTKNERMIYPHGTSLPAWPHSLTMHPTLLLLAAAVVAVLFNVFALAALVGFDRFRTTGFGNVLTNLSLLAGLGTWIAALVYYKLWDTGKVQWWDLWSWACTHKQFEILEGNHRIGFGTICREMVSTSAIPVEFYVAQ